MVISADVPEALVARIDAMVQKVSKPRFDPSRIKKIGSVAAYKEHQEHLAEYRSKTQPRNRSVVIRLIIEAGLEAMLGKSE